MKRKGWANILLLVLLSIGIPVFLATVLHVFLFRINRFALDLTVRGEKEVTVEYGDSYTDEGADARFYGSYVMREGKDVPVLTSGEVNAQILGTYDIRYSAEYLTTQYRVGTDGPEETEVTDYVHIAFG